MLEAASPLSDAVAVRGQASSSILAIPRKYKAGRRQLAQQEASPGIASPSRAPTRGEMVDVEATLHLVVENVVSAAASVRGLARTMAALVVEDAVDEGATATGRFTVRVEAEKTDEFLAGCERLGQVRLRQVQARDIGQEYHDSQLLLENLEHAMHRYEEILKTAAQVTDVLAVEKELGRLRTQIERVKGSLLWMQDRVARSTVHVHLASLRSDESEGIVVPHAKIYPGVRVAYLQDYRGDGGEQGYLGVGLSLRFVREFGLDLDAFRRSSGGQRLDAFIATMGGELFSDFLGRGRRRALNPYLGWRIGYARMESRNHFAFAGAVGIELVRTKVMSIDLACRLYGLLGDTNHVAVEPALAWSFAF